MHHVLPIPRRSTRLVASLLPLAALLLAACSGAPRTEQSATPERYDYSLSVAVKPNAVKSEVETRYGGQAVVWNPEAGFAVLGLNADGLSVQNTAAEPNRDAISIPSVNSLSYDAYGNGYTAWGGGYTAWGGGYTAWGGGTTQPTTFSGNLSAWNQIKLLDAQRLAPRLGANIKVAVIDTGVDLTHPALAGKLAPASEWKDFVDGDAYPQDQQNALLGGSNAGHGHGTGVAGVILQVAPNAKILPLRVLDADGRGDLTSVAAAVDWAVKRGADVINLSLGGYVDSATIEATLRYAANYRTYTTVSAGNSADNQVTFPAILAPNSTGVVGQYLVSVASVTPTDVKSAFSSFGPEVELSAPGERVVTLAPGGVMHRTGTSFAAPMAAGALALAMGEAALPSGQGTLTLVASSDSSFYSKNPGYLGLLGSGRLDVNAFVKKALGR